MTLSVRSRGDELNAPAPDHGEGKAQSWKVRGALQWWSTRVARMVGKWRRVSWALIDQSIISAANFLTIYLFARHLETAHFGAFILAYTGLQFVTNLQNALLIQPHNVLGAGLPPAEYRNFTGSVMLLQAISCVAACAVLVTASITVTLIYSAAAGGLILILGLAIVPWMGREFVRRVQYTRGESKGATINDGVAYGLQVLSAFVWMRSHHATAEAALVLLGGSSLVGVLVGGWQLRSHVSFGQDNARTLKHTWNEVWNFGKWLIGQNLLLWFGSQGHAWLVGLMLGIEQVGLYRAVTHLANVMNPLRQAAYSYLPSRGSLAYQRGGRQELIRWVHRAWWILIVALVPFFIVLVGFPGQTLHFAYGDRYTDHHLTVILALSTIAQCIMFAKFPFDVGLLAQRGTKAIFMVHLLPVVLLFTAGVAFIHFMGILGVPLSGMLISTTLLITTWVAYSRHLKRNDARQSAGRS